MQPFTIDVLYGDHEGGQRTITRFGMIPLQTDDDIKWFPNVARHWNLERPDPPVVRKGDARRVGSGRFGAETSQQGLAEAVVAGVLVLDETEAKQLEGDPAVDGGPDELRRLGRRPLLMTPACMARCTAATRLSNVPVHSPRAPSLGSNRGRRGGTSPGTPSDGRGRGPVAACALPQSLEGIVDLGHGRHLRAQPFEALDEERLDDPKFQLEVVVDAHGRHVGGGGDPAHREAVGPLVLEGPGG